MGFSVLGRRLAAIAMVMMAAGVGACSRGAAEAAPGGAAAGRPPAPVTIAVAQAQDVPVYLNEIGHAQPSEYVSIVSQVAGQVMTRNFKDGAMLHQGQVLFTIDKRTYQAKVDEAQANLESAQAQVELAKPDYQRILQGFKAGAASQEDLDTKKGALDTALAQVKVAQAALDTAKLNLGFCTISCPIDGRAGQRLVDAGNVVKANDASMLVVQRLSPIYVDFTVTEDNLLPVRRLSSEGRLQAIVSPPQTNETYEGPLTFIDSNVQQGAGRVRVQATLPNKDLALWPGQFVNVQLNLRTIKGAVLIPYACTQMGQQGTYVYVVNANDEAEQRTVTLGQRQGEGGNLVVVASGVKAGDKVVETGQLAVTPGGKVRVVTPVVTPTGGADSNTVAAPLMVPATDAAATQGARQ